MLEDLLGPATVVVESGGTWVNGGNTPEDKLHLHWRLARAGHRQSARRAQAGPRSRGRGSSAAIPPTSRFVTRSAGRAPGTGRPSRGCARSSRSTPTSRSSSRRRWQDCRRRHRRSRKRNPTAPIIPATAATGTRWSTASSPGRATMRRWWHWPRAWSAAGCMTAPRSSCCARSCRPRRRRTTRCAGWRDLTPSHASSARRARNIHGRCAADRSVALHRHAAVGQRAARRRGRGR